MAEQHNVPLRTDTNDLTGPLTSIAVFDTLTRLLDDDRMVGDVINIDYTTADVLVHDSAKQDVGGVQQGCLLVAARSRSAGEHDATQRLVLLRALRSSPLPNHIEMRHARFNAGQRVADTPNNWDQKDVTDIFTLNQMRYAGVQCRILGSLRLSEENGAAVWEFHTDIDNFYSGQGLKVYKPTGDPLERIINDTSRQSIQGSQTRIGYIRYAMSTAPDPAAVSVIASDFLAQRTALFGMTRTGKSNTVKTIASAVFELRRTDPSLRVGQLIFDPNGEYANDNPQDQGCLRNVGNREWAETDDILTYGLYRHPHDPERRITKFNFYGNELPIQHPGTDAVNDHLSSLNQGKAVLDELLADESAGYVKPFVETDMTPPADRDDFGAWTRYRRMLFVYRSILAVAGYDPPAFGPVTRNLFRGDLRDLMSGDDGLAPYCQRLANGLRNWQDAGTFVREMARWVKTNEFRRYDREYGAQRDDGPSQWSDANLLGLLRIFDNSRGLDVVGSAREWHDPDSGDYVNEIVEYVQDGKLVMIDQAIGNPSMNKRAAKRIMQAVFSAQQRAFVSPLVDAATGALKQPPPVIVYVEEAHTLLPKAEDDMSNIWVRIAKEGAKFNIGLVYSTQEPSTIQPNILKNTENWFIAHLNNTDETRQIAKFNDFSDFAEGIISVNEPGFLKMRSLSNKFTLPVQIDEFVA